EPPGPHGGRERAAAAPPPARRSSPRRSPPAGTAEAPGSRVGRRAGAPGTATPRPTRRGPPRPRRSIAPPEGEGSTCRCPAPLPEARRSRAPGRRPALGRGPVALSRSGPRRSRPLPRLPETTAPERPTTAARIAPPPRSCSTPRTRDSGPAIWARLPRRTGRRRPSSGESACFFRAPRLRPHRHGAEQVLDVVVVPPQTRSEEERVGLPASIQEVVPSAGHIDRRREEIPRRELPVRGEGFGAIEVEDLAGETEPVVQHFVIDGRASSGLDQTGTQREVVPPAAHHRRDAQLVFELCVLDRGRLGMTVGKRGRDDRGRQVAHPVGLRRELDLVELRRILLVDGEPEIALRVGAASQVFRAQPEI